ncbi:hypothetical protein DH2020_042049 [Rehmannia glutinosa]|uniref:Adenylate-forming reductase n=1 Tax=Rehmannia glutinosa TaxID=99300 RepID=A0ABR0UP60_REHGL
MENHEKIGRFSSCRGVAFEIKRHADPFAIPERVINPSRNSSSRRSWLPWGSLSRVVPSSELFQRSMSGPAAISAISTMKMKMKISKLLLTLKKAMKKIRNSINPHCHFFFHRPSSNPNNHRPRLRRNRLEALCLFTVYKRLFVVCLALNITGLVLAAIGEFPYARNRAALFSIANIFVLVLCRSEAFLRVVFWLAVNVLGWYWVPLKVKTMTTSLLQSLGGIHSGCGISSITWLVYALILTLKNRGDTTPEIIAVASVILGLLCLSSLAAFPLLRHLHHNVFERTHRFAGWTALALLWAFVILTISYDPLTKSYRNNLGSRLIKHQEFWFTLGITVLIIIPWLSIRRVHVRTSSPSGHAAIIKFDGGIKAGILGRISPSPFSEWHAFGIISDNKTEHMMLAGAVGDFTKSLVDNPPNTLWVRKVRFAGLPYLTNMYGRVLLVATGSGICVFLSFLLQPCKADVCLLWVTKGVEQNFGREIKEWMSGHPKEKVIVHDTAVLGRPNVSEMSVDAARRFGAEVVIVTSNPEGSRDVVNACKAAGIAAFGPIWDS